MRAVKLFRGMGASGIALAVGFIREGIRVRFQRGHRIGEGGTLEIPLMEKGD